MNASGLRFLVATDASDYVEIAATLAADQPRLAGLRKAMRDRLLRSPLMDAARFTRHFESALRDMLTHG